MAKINNQNPIVNLFVYGTLMSEKVWFSVVGRRYLFEYGKLTGFARKQLAGEIYPVMIREENAVVNGIIYKNILSEDLRKLDEFEGESYLRINVKIESTNETTISCHTYIAHDPIKHKIIDSPWDFERFLKIHLEDFLNGYPGWQKIENSD